MGKILVIGSTNTDMVVRSKRFPAPGETILGGEFFMFPGGKGANQAVAAARLGGEVSFITRVGDDVFGSQALEGFEEEGIDTTHITIDKDRPSGVALITVDGAGENQIVVASGANAQIGQQDIEEAISVFTQSDIILVQLEIPLTTVARIISLAQIHNKKVILNPAPAQALGTEILAGLYCITPNQTEAQLLTGIPVNSVESARQAAEVLLDKGVQHVVITMGDQGSVYVSPDDFLYVAAPTVDVIDTTAAGDVYNGALSVGLARSKSWKEAIAFATQAAAIAVTKMGAQASAPYLVAVESL